MDFYESIKGWRPLEMICRASEKKVFDVYEVSVKMVFALSGGLSRLANGLLHTYLAWMFLGAMILIYILMR